ncbi:hypothetical protein XENTR_v10005280 [Xenopus tropicalis]|nr:hypothetical protein XENTR_v10005280 [Xenopus tropicalis]
MTSIRSWLYLSRSMRWSTYWPNTRRRSKPGELWDQDSKTCIIRSLQGRRSWKKPLRSDRKNKKRNPLWWCPG